MRKVYVPAGQFFETLSDIHVTPGRSVAGLQDQILPFVASAVAPATIPSTLTPLAAAPATELGAVDNAAFAVFKHAVLTVGSASVNPQRLYATLIGIDSKGGIPHAKSYVTSRQFLEALGDINVPVGSTVAGGKNLILALVAVRRFRHRPSLRSSHHRPSLHVPNR